MFSCDNKNCEMRIHTLIKPIKITFVHSMMYKSRISGYARSLKEYFQIGIFLLDVEKYFTRQPSWLES